MDGSFDQRGKKVKKKKKKLTKSAHESSLVTMLGRFLFGSALFIDHSLQHDFLLERISRLLCASELSF